MPRLFTGLEIPAEIGQTLSMLRGGLPGARWIDPENYHLTLRFIGDVDDRPAHEIASLLIRAKSQAVRSDRPEGLHQLRRHEAARGRRAGAAQPRP